MALKSSIFTVFEKLYFSYLRKLPQRTIWHQASLMDYACLRSRSYDIALRLRLVSNRPQRELRLLGPHYTLLSGLQDLIYSVFRFLFFSYLCHNLLRKLRWRHGCDKTRGTPFIGLIYAPWVYFIVTRKMKGLGWIVLICVIWYLLFWT